MTDSYWEYAQRKNGEYPEHTSRGGKWLIFMGGQSLARIWRKIKTAVEDGRLGGLAKTPRRSTGFREPGGVICVYTYDWHDYEDVRRIRDELRKIGILRKISYKADEDTERGRYRTNSREKLSKYYE